MFWFISKPGKMIRVTIFIFIFFSCTAFLIVKVLILVLLSKMKEYIKIETDVVFFH